jgi:hypothetical protein
MADAFEAYGAALDFERILDRLEEVIIEKGKPLIDPAVPPKPLIGVVGEIYLRTHVQSNQDVIRMIEKYGGEVVNASIAEWVNYTTYDRKREARIGLRLSLKQLRVKKSRTPPEHARLRHRPLLPADEAEPGVQAGEGSSRSGRGSSPGSAGKGAQEEDLYSFDVGTEACLSISGILEYVRHGYNGAVNVYPFHLHAEHHHIIHRQAHPESHEGPLPGYAL